MITLRARGRSKLLSGVLVAALVAASAGGSLAACGSSSDDADPDASPTPGIDGSSSDGSSAGDGPGPGTDGGPGADASEGSDGDASLVDASNPAPCTREAEARPAPAALYDALVADLATLAGAARQARVDTFYAAVEAGGGSPLEDPLTGRVVFVARGAAPAGSWVVATSLSGFDPALGLSLVAVTDTDLHAAQVTVPRGASFQYKLASGTTLYEDPLAKNLTWDGITRDPMGPGQMNAIGHPMDWPPAKGRVVRFGRLHATMLNVDRDVWLYLPPRYENGTCANLPSILFHDGNAMLTHGDFASAADATYAAQPDLSAVAVIVAAAPDLNPGRFNEYTWGGGSSKGPAHVDFLLEDVWPAVKASSRLCNLQGARGIAGGSLGGLIATWAAFEHPTTWGWIGAQSASYWWQGNELITRVANNPAIAARVYIDSATTCSAMNVDNCDAVTWMGQSLAAKAYDYTRVSVPGGEHTWASFRTRFGQMLTHFRQGQTTICD